MRQYRFDEFSIVISASNIHNKKNINCTVQEALNSYRDLAKMAKDDSKPFRAYVSCAFGCPYEGRVNYSSLIGLCEQLLDMGAYELSISDTIGTANPYKTRELILELTKHIPASKIALHMHGSRNMALTNVYAAIGEGIRVFDSSFGGLGGCPFAYGASGNVATEDLVSMCYNLNIKTSVNIYDLCKASLYARNVLSRDFPSKIFTIYNS